MKMAIDDPTIDTLVERAALSAIAERIVRHVIGNVDDAYEVRNRLQGIERGALSEEQFAMLYVFIGDSYGGEEQWRAAEVAYQLALDFAGKYAPPSVHQLIFAEVGVRSIGQGNYAHAIYCLNCAGESGLADFVDQTFL